MLAAVLDEEWTIERVELLLRVLLRTAVFELSERLEVPARVVISEYVDLTSAFYDGREIAFVNGLLDRLAHVLSAEEFGGPADPPKLRAAGAGSAARRVGTEWVSQWRCWGGPNH